MLTGPSGVGKDTVLRELFDIDPQLDYCVSYTTRPPRPGEVEGVSYFFVDEPEFRAMIDRGEFFEWSTVYGELKGRTFETVNRSIASGKDTVIKIDVQGAEKVRARIGGEGIYIFLLPPASRRSRSGSSSGGPRTRRACARAASARSPSLPSRTRTIIGW